MTGYDTSTCSPYYEAVALCEHFQKSIKAIYDNATSSIQINRHVTNPIPIRRCIRQRLTLSMQLFALCLNPLLRTFEDKLPGIRIGGRCNNTAVVAYGDDVTLFIKTPEEIPITQDTIRRYEAASGVHLNVRKSKAVATGTWDTTTNIMDIPCYTEIQIFGFNITSSGKQSAHSSWSKVTNRVGAQASEAYCRDLRLSQRNQYVHAFLLARIWYTVQIFPAPDECVRQLNLTITWYIWHGETLRVPLSTLQRRKGHGRWDLIDVAAKSRAILFDQMRLQGLKNRTITAAWLQKWDLLKPYINPPYINRIPAPLA